MPTQFVRLSPAQTPLARATAHATQTDQPRPEEVAAAKVVPGFWVAVDYTDGHRHCAYPMGTAEAAEAEVRADYYGAVQDYELRRAEFLDALQPFREHAANISAIAAAAYAEGGTDLLRLLDAERARLDAELAWARGMVDYRQSIVRLEAAEGVSQ